VEKRIQGQLRAGKGMLKIAAEYGVGSGTFQRIKHDLENAALSAARAAA
jgi:hypothetical protein